MSDQPPPAGVPDPNAPPAGVPAQYGAPPPQQYGGPPPAAGWTPSGPSGPRAGFWKRLLAALLDGILLGIVGSVVAAMFGQNAFEFDDGTTRYGLSGFPFVITTAIQAAYYIYLEGSASGQTLGKRALGIRVIDFNAGGPIGYGRAGIRWIGRLVSAIPCALGYLWMLWDKQKQTWHDKFATAVVVPTDAYPVDKWPG